MKLMSAFLIFIALSTFVHSKDFEQPIKFKQPEETVKAFEATTINLLKMSNAESKSQCFVYALKQLKSLFDFNTIGALVLGNYLENETKESKGEFIKELQNLTARTMVLNYVNYTTQRYEPIKTKKTKNRAFISTEFYVSDEEAIPFRFILKNNQGNWQIINIIASGVSELSIKRIEYQSFLETKSLSDLIQEIKLKNQI